MSGNCGEQTFQGPVQLGQGHCGFLGPWADAVAALLPQTSHTETSGVGPGDQVETEHPPTAEMESDLRRTGNEDWRASKGGGRASERCEASDVKDEEGEDADPPQWTSPPREDDDVFYLFFQKQK